MRTLLRNTVAVSPCLPMLVLSLGVGQGGRCYAQTQTQSAAQTTVAALHEPPASGAEHVGGKTSDPVPSGPAAVPDPEISPAVAKQFAAMQAEIEELKAELKGRSATEPASPSPGGSVTSAPAAAPARPEPAPTTTSAGPAVSAAQAPSESPAAKPAKQPPSEPFAFADWSWMNGSPHNKEPVWDSKFFTPEIRLDTDYVSSFNHPKDDSLGGSTEIFRSNEVQVEQISFGGDFHWQNVRGRILTLGGMFSVTTPRNDGSVGRGQWDLRGAYKYFGEAYGGYHFNVNHGLNVDAGIFVSYIGLFSYWNFDNWAYQPSYVSSNTPWFFNGVRIQWFPTEKLKIEPWIINGWQSYARYGNVPGLGGQILYRPKPWLSWVFNNYGMGEDTLGLNGARSRLHTDDSVEVKYYDHPEKFLDKMAFTFTGDLGCEYGGGVSCLGNKKSAGQIVDYKQVFAGWMLYDRTWFKKDKYAITLGGGVLDNPGRYLTLLQPINGADAVSGSPYFPVFPGSVYKAWDNSASFYYMPRQYISFVWEFGYRHANVPYFTGRGGITPPNGNNGSPADYVCNDGSSTGFGWAVNPNNPTDPNGANLGLAQSTCNANSHGGLWTPDLRKDEPSIRMAIMVKF
ncbi:MAG: outer membrane beta-barrel protein [Candidatus Sulfotelmatobacter sp.]